MRIIDAWFEEKDGLVIVDYKTDRVKEGEEQTLLDHYQVQLQYYARALSQITGKRVKEAVIYSLLKRYIASLESICDTLEHHDGSAIYRMFEESGKYRSSFPNRGRGPIERDYSFSVDVLDEPGSISVLSAILAAKGISVKNMGINHSREEGEGALRISFYKEEQKNENHRCMV